MKNIGKHKQKMSITLQNNQKGAAAIFIVLFFTLLIGVITLSFITIVSQDQQQAINNDLSQSAYDSAEAGVEDGKRVLQAYRECVVGTPCQGEFENSSFVRPGTPTDNTCYSIFNVRAKIGVTADLGNEPEVKVSRPGSQDDKLNQAYSCVSIATQTADFVYTQDANKVDLLVPLKPAAGGQVTNFDISWFDKTRDTGDSVAPTTFHTYPDLARDAADWGEKTPSLLRLQLIKVAKSGSPNLTLDEIDKDSKAAFLYPSSSGATSVNLTTLDLGRNQPKSSQPAQVRCSSATVYSCTVSVSGGIDTTAADYYLRVLPIYNKATYRVQMKDAAGAIVYFDNVQPSIDSTGRANNLFRRVETRVTYDDEMAATLGGFDSTESICKAFSVAASPDDYDKGSACDP